MSHVWQTWYCRFAPTYGCGVDERNGRCNYDQAPVEAFMIQIDRQLQLQNRNGNICLCICLCVCDLMDVPRGQSRLQDRLVRKRGYVISNDCRMRNSICDYRLIYVSVNECSNYSKREDIL